VGGIGVLITENGNHGNKKTHGGHDGDEDHAGQHHRMLSLKNHKKKKAILRSGCFEGDRCKNVPRWARWTRTCQGEDKKLQENNALREFQKVPESIQLSCLRRGGRYKSGSRRLSGVTREG